MSLTEETATEPAPPPGEAIAGVGPAVHRVLLVWDAPNLDMGLGSILGRRPTALERPRFDALGRWLLARTAEVAAKRQNDQDIAAEPEATVFTNIAPGSADVVRPWVDALRNVGFAVFAKPKLDEDSDVDSVRLDSDSPKSDGLPFPIPKNFYRFYRLKRFERVLRSYQVLLPIHFNCEARCLFDSNFQAEDPRQYVRWNHILSIGCWGQYQNCNCGNN